MAGSGQLNRGVVAAGPTLLAGAVFVIAFTHIHDIAVWAGRKNWEAWIIACTGEIMAVVAIFAILARRHDSKPAGWPVFVLVVAVIFSAACNLAAAFVNFASDPPGIWVALMAIWPVVAFGLCAGLKATKPDGDAGEMNGERIGAGERPEAAPAAAPADPPRVETTEVGQPANRQPQPVGQPPTATANRNRLRTNRPTANRNRSAARLTDADRLAIAREVAADREAAGGQLTKDGLMAAFRARGHGLGSDTARRTLDAYRADRAKQAKRGEAAAGWVPADPELVPAQSQNGSAP